MNHDASMNLEYRGPVTMKGKPEPMECWLLSRKSPSNVNTKAQTTTATVAAVKSTRQQSSAL